jgi:hypothetical protein
MNTQNLAVSTTAAAISRTRWVVGAAFASIMAGAIFLNAPSAHADPPTPVQTDCEAAGGTYTDGGYDGGGNHYEKCCFEQGWARVVSCDYYVNGVYSSSDRNAPPQPGAGSSPSRPRPVGPTPAPPRAAKL